MISNLKQLVLAFVVTLTCLIALVKSNLPNHLAHQIERGRLQAVREELPSTDDLEQRYLDGRRVAEVVAPAVVSIVSDRGAAGSSRSEREPARRPGSSAEESSSSSASAPRGGAPGRPVHGLGSGFVFDGERGLILTNAHVVAGASGLSVHFADGRRASAKVLGMDESSDLAVLEVEDRPLHALTLADSSRLGVGEEVFSVGSPFGLVGTFSKGIISSARERSVTIGPGVYEGLIQTDAVVNPGNSGGPLVNMRGEVVGVNTAIATTDGVYQGVGFAIPSNRVRAMLDDLITGGPAFLGVQPIDRFRSREPSQSVRSGSPVGVLIADVVEGSAAHFGGLQKLDLVERVDGNVVRDARHLIALIAARTPGENMTLDVVRDGAAMTLTVTLGRRYEPR
ncbi:MAG: trypsin-like peptidase domain-containing protein [Phycisphaerae bacterium]|nr:trypsin-like peptidase domain-containing protein [Planctomycetia bacterium]MCK6464922.1 trypsin-like peptidase domain-containing protein [Phycisphaerae bacterium]MCL4719189.1 trypsin-like peptidase domain-containing protein [Phycisphaerae bacterium]NUQ08914.1 trypsin-like peptidase domain-containing protein [Phycisphaerae bacterium]